jgi:hypothetical protein
MSMSLIPILSAAVAASAAPAPADCPLSVRFGSYAMGIDRPAAVRIESFLQKHRAVAGIKRHPWGREGEYTLCVSLKRGANPAALFDELKPLVPAKGRGPIAVKLRNGRSFGTGG